VADLPQTVGDLLERSPRLGHLFAGDPTRSAGERLYQRLPYQLTARIIEPRTFPGAGPRLTGWRADESVDVFLWGGVEVADVGEQGVLAERRPRRGDGGFVVDAGLYDVEAVHREPPADPAE